MAKDKKEPEVKKSLDLLGVMYRTANSFEESGGTADILAFINGVLLPIEVKNSKTTFAHSQWRDNQREWAEYMLETTGCETHLAILCGKRINSRKNRRGMWVIPFKRYLWEEAKCTRKSFTVSMLREKFREFEWVWDGDKTWKPSQSSFFILKGRVVFWSSLKTTTIEQWREQRSGLSS